MKEFRINEDGYTKADEIDKILNNLLEKYPMNWENIQAWVAFSRTIKTSIGIINEEALRIFHQAIKDGKYNENVL
jgi:hypothetical protein